MTGLNVYLYPRWCKTCEAHGDLIPATGTDDLCDECRADRDEL